MTGKPEFDSRETVFDLLKGIGILFVIIGHSDIGPLNAFINSFHMPLFFFITGYFLKKRSISQEIRLCVQRLLVPYLFTAFGICVVCISFNIANHGPFREEIIIRFLFGFYGTVFPDWIAGTIGVLWFILALFWARIIASVSLLITEVIQKKWFKYVTQCFMFICFAEFGIFLEDNFSIPFCIPQGFAASGFVYIGYIIKKFNVFHDDETKYYFPILAALFFFSWNHGGMSVASSVYPIGYVFGLLGAAGAFVTFFHVVKQLYSANSRIWRMVLFFGRYSLIIYCVHSVDPPNDIWKTFVSQLNIPSEYFNLFQISVRLAIVFGATCLILKIPLIRRHVFQIK